MIPNKKIVVQRGRPDARPPRAALAEPRTAKTVLTFESASRAYHWTISRGRCVTALKH
ncbi:MAG: hypothetical protein HKL90_00380 [Elusimicrobia bacterium]|nr:hypothetical protein [Elusimicrobiota bacterium]